MTVQMDIQNPENISLEKLNKLLSEICKSVIISPFFNKKKIIITRFKGTRQIITKNSQKQISVKNQIPPWWNLIAIIFTIIFSYAFLWKLFDKNIIIPVISIIIAWFISLYSFFIFFHQTIKNFNSKLKDILLKKINISL